MEPIKLVSDTTLYSEKEMRALGAIPAIRGYVKHRYPDKKGNGVSEINVAIRGPIDALDRETVVDVYAKPKGKVIGYALLPDGTYVGITKERVNKKTAIIGGIALAAVVATAVIIVKMDEEDKNEIRKEIERLKWNSCR